MGDQEKINKQLEKVREPREETCEKRIMKMRETTKRDARSD
jgi:hypothetical protein